MTSQPFSSVRNLWCLAVTLVGAFKSAPYHHQPFIVWVFAFDPGGPTSSQPSPSLKLVKPSIRSTTTT